MRICIDIQAATAQRAGVGRYTRELVRHLPLAAPDLEWTLAYFDFQRKGAPFPVPGATFRGIRWCPGRLAQWSWKTLHTPPYNWFAGPADVYHFPNFVLPPLQRGRSVVTIHDVSFLRLPAFAEEKNLRYLTARIRDTVRRTDAVITDSRFCAAEIHELLRVPEERLHPVLLGIEPSFERPAEAVLSSTLTRLDLDRPYLLTVGTLEPRKGIPFLVDVFERLKGFDGLLVIAGMPGWKFEPILRRMQNSVLANRIRWLRYVDDADLPALYAGASLFLCGSYYEGFGFPPLEAMACGTPVLSSSCGALRETLGGGATLMDGFDVDAWVAAAEPLLSRETARQAAREAGRRQASRYRWEETARQTAALYRKVAS